MSPHQGEQTLSTEKRIAGISSAAVKAKTGKTWDQWLDILDKAGAKKMTHQEIVALLGDKHGVGDWWQQMVTVGYEQARGLREKHQTSTGYQAGASKTVAVPMSQLFQAWSDARKRARWLSDPRFTVRKATPNKSMRITWVDGKTDLDVYFWSKGQNKSQVTLEHTRLSTQQEVERRKAYWAKALERLKELLER